MQSKIIFVLKANGNLEQVITDTDVIYQGQVGTVEYRLEMSPDTPVDEAWKPSDVVFLALTRPDGQSSQISMTYKNDGWEKTSNGWESDVEVADPEGSDLLVSFIARRYSSDFTQYSTKTTQQAVVKIMPSSGYTPLDISVDDADMILAEIGELSGNLNDAIADYNAKIGDLSDLKTASDPNLVAGINKNWEDIGNLFLGQDGIWQSIGSLSEDVGQANHRASLALTNIGSLGNLDTDAKDNLVNAINEVNNEVDIVKQRPNLFFTIEPIVTGDASAILVAKNNLIDNKGTMGENLELRIGDMVFILGKPNSASDDLTIFIRFISSIGTTVVTTSRSLGNIFPPIPIIKRTELNDFVLKSSVRDRLDWASATDPLSANMGRVLNDKINGMQGTKAFNTISDMVNFLNQASDEIFQVGGNLWIVELNVPDFWVTEVMPGSVPYTYTTDEALVDAVTTEPLQIGYYKISLLETQKVDLDLDAQNIEYDNTSSELAANNVQEAIDEVVDRTPYSSANLNYEELANGYRVLASPNVTQIRLVIPSEYRGQRILGTAPYAFQNNELITHVTILAELSTIAASVFEGCNSIRGVEMPDTLALIGNSAFRGCSYLEKITLPDRVGVINAKAFENCSSLKTIVLTGISPPALGEDVFNNIHEDFGIYVPLDSIEAYKTAEGWSQYADKIDAIATKSYVDSIGSGGTETLVVNNIAERDALEDLAEGAKVYVKDASADPDVGEGWAEYIVLSETPQDEAPEAFMVSHPETDFSLGLYPIDMSQTPMPNMQIYANVPPDAGDGWGWDLVNNDTPRPTPLFVLYYATGDVDMPPFEGMTNGDFTIMMIYRDESQNRPEGGLMPSAQASESTPYAIENFEHIITGLPTPDLNGTYMVGALTGEAQLTFKLINQDIQTADNADIDALFEEV